MKHMSWNLPANGKVLNGCEPFWPWQTDSWHHHHHHHYHNHNHHHYDIANYHRPWPNCLQLHSPILLLPWSLFATTGIWNYISCDHYDAVVTLGMETFFFTLLVICQCDPPVTSGFPSLKPWIRGSVFSLCWAIPGRLRCSGVAGDERHHDSHAILLLCAFIALKPQYGRHPVEYGVLKVQG